MSPTSVNDEEEEEKFTKEFALNDGGACCAALSDCAYAFGGRWDYGYAVHELNLETMVWGRLEPQNREEGPVHKIGARMAACGEEALCVFGGFGLETLFTNELHLFHLDTGRSAGFVWGGRGKEGFCKNYGTPILQVCTS